MVNTVNVLKLKLTPGAQPWTGKMERVIAVIPSGNNAVAVMLLDNEGTLQN